ncbi:hypothetical protein NECAME_16370, partial [Necator americanus]
WTSSCYSFLLFYSFLYLIFGYFHGFYFENNCRSDEGGRQVAGIVVSFESCGLIRTRSLNPRGVFVLLTLVVSFHPKFLTKVDRAYRVSCFYMEADKDVTSLIAVSDITTESVTGIVQMPICKYEVNILDSNGCALDRYVLNDLEYPEDLLAG